MRMGSSDGDAAVPGGVRPFLASALAGLGPHVIHDERDAPRPVGNGAWGLQTGVSIPVTAGATKRYLSLVVTHRGFPRGTRSAVGDTLTWSLTGAGASLGGTVKASDLHHVWLSSMAGGRTLGGARPFWVIPLGFVADGGATAGVTVTTASARGEWVVAAVLTDDSQALAGVGRRFVAPGAGVPENHVRINDRPAAIPFGSRPLMSGDSTPSGAAEGFDRDEDFSPDLEELAAGTNPGDKSSAPVVLSSLISRRLTQRHRPNPHGWIGFQDLTENIGWALFEPSTASAVGIPLLGLTYQTYLIPGTQFETGYLSEAQYLGAPRGHADDFVSLWGKQGKKPTVERGLPADNFGREVFDPAWDVDATMALYVPEPQRKLFEPVPYWPEFIATIGKRYRLRGPSSEADQSRTFLKVRWEKTWPSYEAYISDVSNFGWAWWPGHSPNTATLGEPVSVGTKTLTIPKGENYSEPEDIVPKLSEGDLPEGQFSDGKPRVVVERLLSVEFKTYPDTEAGPDKAHKKNLETRQNETAKHGVGWEKVVCKIWDSSPGKVNLIDYLNGGPGNHSTFENVVKWRVNGTDQTSHELSLGDKPDPEEHTHFYVQVLPKHGGDTLDRLIITVVPPETKTKFDNWYAAESTAAGKSWFAECPPMPSSLVIVEDDLHNIVPYEPDVAFNPRIWNPPNSINTYFHPDGHWEIRAKKTAGGHGHQATFERGEPYGQFYENRGEGAIILDGVSAGTADKAAAFYFPGNPDIDSHVDADVKPFVWALQLDGNPCDQSLTTLTLPMLHEGAFIKKYMECRPIEPNAKPRFVPPGGTP
jgi:hypothetical protein